METYKIRIGKVNGFNGHWAKRPKINYHIMVVVKRRFKIFNWLHDSIYDQIVFYKLVRHHYNPSFLINCVVKFLLSTSFYHKEQIVATKERNRIMQRFCFWKMTAKTGLLEEVKNVYEGLKGKVEKIAENYADLVDSCIRNATEGELSDATIMTEVNEAIRMLGHISATLERVDRLNRGNDVSSQL